MNDTELSIEFFPPQTEEGAEKLRAVRARLAELRPSFFSVTYGAGGSTRERTFATVKEIAASGSEAAPHLSCIGSTRDSIRAILAEYAEAGIKRIVALRGDLPSGVGDAGEFRYANELVAFIRAETGQRFRIEIAAYPEWHPQARSPKDDLLAFKRKAEAGADSAITQYFYNIDAYLHFVDAVRGMGVDIPIIPGIMPIASFSKLARFSDACGTEIPRWMRKKFEAFGDDSESIRAFGLDVVTAMCEKLIASGAPGLHFYSMNQSALTTEICQRLKLA
ncbi:MAG: methylenetetrahydrofolate reductase [NAD(P)H] [Azoarcus sp.]|jgi:methylenetetrahydrofolate reductase (NADPH)|uniref:Methylenetetrahydrofolate reductase n=1 Tax=Parazoarcus communis TaxID=41977 RepID=A0A2U8GVW8_9RHOO|nr:methylenetetrahydrofolate reductase [NAD(P)H] [Parazoarcus communis]AWI77176.1 methylenetetrahydrofolate reductase [NAD(P)H] [Parazoarcus communis]PLX72739.1 MAG: methylenetetrahydrofolate reductase [NAD(P)H] [Azoarcus sp.]TVT58364.1 MAG: methylenetetrahydrofolate reductase [NAD(P)H] [Azoarcus sp. PHD]